MSRRNQSSRAGAALVLALVLLAALLLLGLPFLYSQSSSLAGTRSYSDATRAQIGAESAAHVATALAAYAMTPYLRAPNPNGGDEISSGTSLAATFSANNPEVPPRFASTAIALNAGTGNRADDDGSIGLDFDKLGLGFNDIPTPGSARQATYLGAQITDESGKFDPNLMGPMLWGRLLAAVHIADWDDGKVYNATDSTQNPGGYACDSDSTIGMLAKALVGVRLSLPQRRITTIEQLLHADPQMGGTLPKLRHRLTRAELGLLLPYLTLHSPRPGRDGLIDLGTVVRIDDVVHHTLWMDSPPDVVHPLLGIGSTLIGEAVVPSGAHQLAVINGVAEDAGATKVIFGKPFSSPDTLATEGQAVMLQVPGALNIHQMPVLVRLALGTAAGSGAALPKPDATGPFSAARIPTIGALSAFPLQPTVGSPTLFDLIDPLRFGIELPPLGIASGGTFSIEAAATITDPLGRHTAQEIRREIVQAVPQEYLLERRWTTQGEMQALVASRFGSRMQSWPVAIERRLDTTTGLPVPPDDPDPASGIAPAPLTSLRPRILPDIATIPQTQDAIFPERLYLQHLKIDWRAVFGGAVPAADSQIFDAECFTGTQTRRVPALDNATLVASEVTEIRPDGYHHRAGSHLAYSLATDFTNGANQQTALLIERDPSDPTHEMGARHLSLWVKPDHDWGTSQGLITLLEARIPTSNAAQEVDSGVLGHTDSQNYFGLLYDPAAELLVLALAPPSIEHTHGTGPAVVPDDLGTFWVDERCLGGVGQQLAPVPYSDGGAGFAAFTAAFAPNRVLHCFKTPAHDGMPHFRAGQWYHLQVAIASDRPDGVTLIVDGMVGRDAMRTADALTGFIELSDFGDHCTLPCAVTKTPISWAEVRSGGDGLPLVLDVPLLGVRNTIAATGAARILAPLSLLPDRGMVRIDDEYLSYDHLASGGVLQHCVRGRRQDTAPSSSDPDQEFPNTQAHRANAIVAPGGYRLQLPAGWGGRLYHGGCDLGQNVTNGDSQAISPHPWQVWAPIDKRLPAKTVAGQWILPSDATSIPLNAAIGTYWQFPVQGIVLLNGNYFYYSGRDDGNHALTGISAIAGWDVTPALPSPAQPRQEVSITAANPEAVVLISMQALGPNPLEEGRYNHSNFTGSSFLIALQDLTGRIEWIHYDHILRNQAAGGVGGGFFLSDTGFDASTRGIGRTAWAGRDTIIFPDPDSVLFPGGTTAILPVQTEFGHAGHWLATGDVVTFMPRPPKATATPNPVVPFQMVVRYAASDGYAAGPGPTVPAMDGPNDYFCFTEQTPMGILRPQPTPVSDYSLALSEYEILSGTCWSGLDLSPVIDTAGAPTAQAEPRGNLPRLDLWSTLYGALTKDASVLIAPGIDCTVDGLCAGGLTHGDVGVDGHERGGSPANAMANGVVWFFHGGVPQTGIGPALADIDGVVAMANTPLFSFALGEMGLVSLDGEVFAYERPTEADANAIAASLAALQANPATGFANVSSIAPITADQIRTSGYYARLVARGLLDSANGGLTHSVGDSADGPYPPQPYRWPHWPVLAATRLPLGPVLLMGDDLTKPWFPLVAQLPETGGPPPAPATLFAPAALFGTAAGDLAQQELIQLIGPKIHYPAPPPTSPDPDAGKYTTASWLRGLYNTPSTTSWGTGATPTVVIGWWPRYASALPHDAANTRTEHFRSRTYSWIGFPFSLYGTYFDPALLTKLPNAYTGLSLARMKIDSESLFTTGGTDFFNVEARALANEEQWSGMVTATQAIMDWSEQAAAEVNNHPDDAGLAFGSGHDLMQCFTANSRARTVDGAEMRLTWRYGRSPDGLLINVAEASGRAPTLTSGHLRGLAPVRALANYEK